MLRFSINLNNNKFCKFINLFKIIIIITNAEMTFPSALKLRLILVASFSLSPVACVLDYLSDPAKSTKLIFPALTFGSPEIVSLTSMYIVKIE